MSDTGKNNDTVEQVPEGFQLLPDGLGFTDNLQPCYRRLEGSELAFGLLVDKQHANSMGICHGGALMTLADIAAASSANLARGIIAGAPTVNLTMDFIGAAKMGQWLQTQSEGVTLKRRFGFSHGIIFNSRGVVARYNATFYFPDHEGLTQDGLPGIGALKGMLDAD
ncbi:PaaI family thioesterase [Halioglobus maricola]|uniref:PaaI family thioesterase n=1 Tax=Halioglobus maricola TaxID=2601894 RepID=A0A5P9NK30_9GAMM|nr:PaaI family thioesterase [Halioglobus maricola]QFU76201.1 PaaI family thioesterase [Halioglobus maricola]